MRVLMTGGGTAGHINPALAIAAKIQKEQPDAEILFVGAQGKMETILVPAAGYPLNTITVQGFQRKLTISNLLKNAQAAYHAVTAEFEAARIIKEFRPDIAIGTGGYVCGPVLRKAAHLGIPVIVHESNAFPGVTVKMLASVAKAVLISDESARKYLPSHANVVVTGNPLGSDFAVMDKATARKELGLDERPFILAFGGSLGARHVNDALVNVLQKSQAENHPFQWMIGTGRGENYTRMQKTLAAQGVQADAPNVCVRDYIDDMPRCMAAADLVICRCGAMTLSELPVMKKPSILIPSPYVAENHQYFNAMALASRGAAVCIEEKELAGTRLWDAVAAIAHSAETLETMGEAASRMAVPDADERIYAAICEALKER